MKNVNDQILMDYLLENYNRTKAKNMLKYKEVKVNGKVITQYVQLKNPSVQPI